MTLRTSNLCHRFLPTHCEDSAVESCAAGAEYTLRSEFEYVLGTASVAERTPGLRDANNVGKTLHDFTEDANRFINERRTQLRGMQLSHLLLPEEPCAYAGLDPSTSGLQLALLPVPLAYPEVPGLIPPSADEVAHLTREEVIAVRIWSGPAYQPINYFLRSIGQVEGQYRERMARDPALTFAATVSHLCHAVRKIAAVALPDETQTLWRAVRGELRQSFWTPDRMNMVVAVDMGYRYRGNEPTLLRSRRSCRFEPFEALAAFRRLQRPPFPAICCAMLA